MVILDVKGTEIRDLYEILHTLNEGKRLKISVFTGPTEKVIIDATVEANELLHLKLSASVETLEL